MDQRTPEPDQKHRRLLADILLGIGAFVVLVVMGLALLYLPPFLAAQNLSGDQITILACLIGIAVLFTLLCLQRTIRRLYHAAANTYFVGPPQRIAMPYVIDGDTIDDCTTGVRYRLANIDAPETGENARCFSERTLGQWAKTEAIRLVRNAQDVSVRKTWRTDRFKRRVAFVLVDGRDLGDMLMERGLAWPWRGYRARWCGRRGALSVLMRGRPNHPACFRCHKRR